MVGLGEVLRLTPLAVASASTPTTSTKPKRFFCDRQDPRRRPASGPHISTTTELDGTVFYNGGFDQDRVQPPNEFEPQICDVVDARKVRPGKLRLYPRVRDTEQDDCITR